MLNQYNFKCKSIYIIYILGDMLLDVEVRLLKLQYPLTRKEWGRFEVDLQAIFHILPWHSLSCSINVFRFKYLLQKN